MSWFLCRGPPFAGSFINTSNFKFGDNVPLLGFLELIQEGRINAYALSKSELIEPNYVPALDMGRKESKLVVKEDYYILKDGKIWELRHRVKDNMKYFGEKSAMMSKYIKSHHLNFNNRDDIRAIFAYYNALF